MRGKWTEGPWATHPLFPTYVVPAEHAGRACGGAADDHEDLVRYAQEIVNTGLFARHRTEAEVRANAYLIAAAPALYEALEAARPAVEVSATEEARGIRRDKGLGLSPRPARWRGVLADIDAALSLAHPHKGEEL